MENQSDPATGREPMRQADRSTLDAKKSLPFDLGVKEVFYILTVMGAAVATFYATRGDLSNRLTQTISDIDDVKKRVIGGLEQRLQQTEIRVAKRQAVRDYVDDAFLWQQINDLTRIEHFLNDLEDEANAWKETPIFAYRDGFAYMPIDPPPFPGGPAPAKEPILVGWKNSPEKSLPRALNINIVAMTLSDPRFRAVPNTEVIDRLGQIADCLGRYNLALARTAPTPFGGPPMPGFEPSLVPATPKTKVDAYLKAGGDEMTRLRTLLVGLKDKISASRHEIRSVLGK